MKTQKRTSSPKKGKKEAVIIGGEPTEGSTCTLEGVVPPEVVRVDHTLIIEELDSRIQELEKALEKANQQVEFQKWIANDRMDALEVLTNNPWYKLLWMRFKGDI